MTDTVKDVAAATVKDAGKVDKPKLSAATKAGIKQDLADRDAGAFNPKVHNAPIERTEESLRPFKGPQSEPTAEQQPASAKVTPIEEQLGMARPPVGDIQDKLVVDDEPTKDEEAVDADK